jgi:hypothetical protein
MNTVSVEGQMVGNTITNRNEREEVITGVLCQHSLAKPYQQDAEMQHDSNE